VPEAEDVVLHAAERATHALRALWRRRDVAALAGGVSLAKEERRLAIWIDATVGTRFALGACDPAPAATGFAGWLARHLGDRPPWADRPVARTFADGERIFVPRHLDETDLELARTRLLLMALGQARRASRGSLAALPAEPAARDVYWSLDGAAGDAWLAARWPGLVPAIDAERARALRSRPPPRLLRPAEGRVEELVRTLLAGGAADAAALAAQVAPGGSDPPSLARAARDIAARLVLEPRHAARRSQRYRGMAPVAHWGVPRADLLGAARASATPSADDTHARPGGRTRALPRRVESREADADELEGRSGPFVLAFGDPELSVQDPAGVQRPRDQGDEPELDALAEELARLDGAARVQAPGAVRDVLVQDEPSRGRPGTSSSTPKGDAPGVVLRFPEWDARRGAYRADHCRVTVTDAVRADAGFSARGAAERARLLGRIRRRFEALRPRRARLPRQLDGDDLDLDGFVGELADACAGVAPAGRIYSLARPRRRDVSVALLLDVSGSTDAQVDGAERVIDVEKAAALSFCEALAVLGDRHAVYAFSGCGPEGVRVRRVKRFDERAPEAVRARIGGLEPESFTRLGAALRFATARLARERSRVRLLLLLSDGKPYDEDEYAGEYGHADVRQAVAEAELAGVRPFCVTVDREGSRYLGRLFGAGRYAVICQLRQLPERLPEIYRRLTAGA